MQYDVNVTIKGLPCDGIPLGFQPGTRVTVPCKVNDPVTGWTATSTTQTFDLVLLTYASGTHPTGVPGGGTILVGTADRAALDSVRITPVSPTGDPQTAELKSFKEEEKPGEGQK